MAPIKELLFGRLALAGRLITEEQIAECLELQHRYEEQGGPIPRLGELLAMKGYMTADQVRAVLEGQHSRREGLFGEIALRWRLITQQDLDQALEIQREQDRSGKQRARLGEILVERGLLRSHQVRAILDAQGKKIVHCSGCNARFNVAQFRAGARLICSKCGATTVLGETERHVADNSPLDVHNTIWISESSPQVPGAPPASGVFPSANEESGTGTGTGTGTGVHTALHIGGYEILSRLGSDAAGNICKARNLTTGDVVALKIMRSESHNQKFLAGFLANSRNAIYLDHPNLKRVYEVGQERNRYFLAEEYVEGKSLKRHLELIGRMTPAEAADCACQIAEALAYGHGRGIFHGDVRPSNVVIDNAGQARLSGLGVAKDAVLNLRFMGKDSQNTPFYLAPEAAVDPAKADARSDVYSLGACLYHMITGRPPYIGQGSLEVLMRLAQENPVPPEQIDPDLPAELCRLVIQMLAAEPEDRPQTMAEVIGKLRQIASRLGPIKAPVVENIGASSRGPVSTVGSARPSAATYSAVSGARTASRMHGGAPGAARRKATGAPMAVFVGLVVVGFIGVALWMIVRDERPAPIKNTVPPVVRNVPEKTPVTPVSNPQDDAASRLYGEAARYAIEFSSDDEGIASRYKAVYEKFPTSSYTRNARENYVKYLSLAAGRALNDLSRGRAAFEARGDYKSGLTALAEWRRKYSEASEDALGRAVAAEREIASAQQAFLDLRFKDADKVVAAGRFSEAEAMLKPLVGTLSPEGSAMVAAKLRGISDQQLAVADEETRKRIEEERRKAAEAERRLALERAAQVAERLKQIRPEVGEMVGHRDFDKAREAVAAFRRQAQEAGAADIVAAAAELDEAVVLATSFHRSMVAAIVAGRPDALVRFDGKPRQAVSAAEQTVTLALSGETRTQLRWDSFEGRDVCDLARGFVARDNGQSLLSFAVYASALGQDAEAKRFLDMAEKAGSRSAAARSAIEGGWLVNDRERRRRAEEAAKLAARAEELRAGVAALVAEWNFTKASEAAAAAKRELAGTPYETQMAQVEECITPLAAFHGAFVTTLKARKGQLTIGHAGKARQITDASATGLTIQLAAGTTLPSVQTWSSLEKKELHTLATNLTDPKDGALLAGCALFLDLAGAGFWSGGVLDQAEKAEMRVAAARAVIAGRLLLTADEKKRREEDERLLVLRFERLRTDVAAHMAAGTADKAFNLLVAARSELAETRFSERRADMEVAAGFSKAFQQVFANKIRSGRGTPRLNYAGQLRKVVDIGADGFAVEVEGARINMPWREVPGARVAALALPCVDQKDGGELLGYALLCSALGEQAEAMRALEAAEKMNARAQPVRAVIEARLFTPQAAPAEHRQ